MSRGGHTRSRVKPAGANWTGRTGAFGAEAVLQKNGTPDQSCIMPANHPRSPVAKLKNEPGHGAETSSDGSGSDELAAKVKAHLRKAVLSLTAKEKKGRW